MHLLRSLDVSRPAPNESLSRRRLIELGLGCTLASLALSARLFQLQILRGAEHRDQADNNRLRVMPVAAQRGLIYDRHRIAMLRNRPSFTISVLPADLPRRPEVVFRRLAKLIGGSATDFGRLAARARTDPFTRLPLRITTDPQAAHAIEERHLDLPGVSVEAEPIREYMDGPLTSHLLGHVGQISEAQLAANRGTSGKYGPNDRLGQGGLEAQFEDELRGAIGEKQAEVDATGREVAVVALDPPRPGNNIHLTIDLALQREVHRILAERIEQVQLATAVVVDPWTGGILAMGHLPAYDNQLFSTSLSEDDFARLLGNPDHPMLNGAVASAWPPGSCFKVVTALASLQYGVVQPDTKVHCGGGIRLGHAFRPCWASHGQQDVISALANSCDTYFYSLVGGESSGRFPGLGADRLAEWARLFGLGAPTGIELPSELAGMVPDTAWKKRVMKEAWYTGDDWISAIGQGFYTATPLQMAMVAATLANGGTLMKPRLVTELTDTRGRSIRRFAPETVRRLPADQSNIELVRAGVRAGMLIGKSPYGANYTGTSYDSKVPEVAIAGKTGTAEYGIEGSNGALPGKLPTHGWFIFWAPHEAPRIAGSVFVKVGGGAQQAAKIARDVVKAYFGIV